MTEAQYQPILNDYIERKINADEFVMQFMNQWKRDRDEATLNDPRFQRLIDRIFTSCDCYTDQPENQFDIDESELRREAELLSHIWFG